MVAKVKPGWGGARRVQVENLAIRLARVSRM